MVASWHQVAAGPIFDEVLRAAAAAGDDRRALRHRLGIDESEGLVPARKREEVGAGHELEHTLV